MFNKKAKRLGAVGMGRRGTLNKGFFYELLKKSLHTVTFEKGRSGTLNKQIFLTGPRNQLILLKKS